MLDKELSKMLSSQVNAEFYSAFSYLAMSASADKMGLKGAAHWLFVQYQEELTHATHMYEYILSRDGDVFFDKIDKPVFDGKTLAAVFDAVLCHERAVTAGINAIATQAMKCFDHATYQFVSWFVSEQVQEESKARDIIDKLKLIKNDTGMLLSLDAQLATRVFVDELAAAKKQ
ncbi:MAG: ferritin [Firmicutes bacterium]|nr:ferritin [Bacillota bacterium]